MSPVNRWEEFAKKNAEFYIDTVPNVDYSTAEGQEAFYRGGEELTEAWMARARPYLEDCGTAVEIGCGIGRMTLPHASHFDHIRAVDVGPTMLGSPPNGTKSMRLV